MDLIMDYFDLIEEDLSFGIVYVDVYVYQDVYDDSYDVFV
jgi:hypothetical protein